MAQLHVYVPDSIAEKAYRLSKERGLTVSKFLAELLIRELGPGWPSGYFEGVVGSWQGDLLERDPQGQPEERDPLVEGEPVTR